MHIFVLGNAEIVVEQPQDSAWIKLLTTHLDQIEAEEDIFVTKSGYFGRYPKGVVQGKACSSAEPI